MISRIHSKLGTAGFIVAIVALVAALGVALAASGLNSKQKKEVKKIAKQFARQSPGPGRHRALAQLGETGAAGPKWRLPALNGKKGRGR